MSGPVTRRRALSLLPLAGAALAAPAAAIAVSDALFTDLSPALAKLIDQHSVFATAYWMNDRRCEELLDAYEAAGRSKAAWEPLRHAERVANNLQSASYPTYEAILDFPVASLADVRAKVGVIRSSPAGGELNEDEARRLLASFVGKEA